MQKKDSFWTAAFTQLFIVNVCMGFGQQMMMALIPKYAQFLGASATIVGMVTSMFAITALLIRPFSGPAFDAFSKKKLLTIALIIIACANFLYSISMNIPMVILARLIHGIGQGCVSPLCLAMVREALPEDKMASGVGTFTLGQTVSQAIAPFIGLTLSGIIGYRGTFLISSLIMCGAVLISLGVKEISNYERPPYRISFTGFFEKKCLLATCIVALISMAYTCVSAFIAIYGAERGVANIGLFFTVNAVGIVIFRPLIGKLADKKGILTALIPTLICFIICFWIISIADSLPVFILAAAFAAIGHGTSYPLAQAMGMKSAPGRRSGAAGNTLYIGADIGNLMGPVIAGRVVDFAVNTGAAAVESYALMYRVMVLPIVLGIILLLCMRKKVTAIWNG